jgi:hypothetical protein
MGDHVRYDGGRWGWRIIRPGGRIRWCGSDYRVTARDGAVAIGSTEYETHKTDQRGWPHGLTGVDVLYDGRLDGMCGLFYTYGDYAALADSVFLHSIRGYEGAMLGGPECVDGVFRFHRWIRIEEVGRIHEPQ